MPNRLPDPSSGIQPSTLTTTGDILYASSAQVAARLAIGSTNQALGVTGGVPAYQASSKSTLTTTGDIIYASAANTPERLGIGSSAQVLTVASGIPSWATPSSGAVTQIAQTVLTATAATITFSSISGYSNLRVVWSGKGPGASTAGLQLRFNGDTGANYYRQRFQATASTGSFGEGLGITSVMVGEIYATVGGGSITIPNYARTVLNKVAVGSHFAIYGTSTGQLVGGMQTGSWANTGAITQLDFTTDSGSFQVGTVFTLYGES